MMTSEGLGGAHPKLATVERDGCGSLWNFFCTTPSSVSPILISVRISPAAPDLCLLTLVVAYYIAPRSAPSPPAVQRETEDNTT